MEASAAMTLDETIRGRRSIRRYQHREVPEALVREILDLASHTPSSMDGQPWCFVVIRNADAKKRLAAIKNAHCPVEKREQYPADFLAAAPVIIAVCVDKRRANDRERENGILATALLLLAAHARGLGSVYLSAYQPHSPALALEVGRLLELPPEIEPVTLIPLGFAAEIPPPKTMRGLTEMIHHERFGG
jgi:nitroreductase